MHFAGGRLAFFFKARTSAMAGQPLDLLAKRKRKVA
jgi:hypothetical protein